MHEDWDIRLEGRHWTPDEMWRQDELPGRLEIVGGRLCIDDDQRILLLAALLEHVGTARAVQLGPFEAWLSAVDHRRETLEWADAPTVGAEQFWRPAIQRLSLKKRLELKREYKARYRLPHRAQSMRRSRAKSPA